MPFPPTKQAFYEKNTPNPKRTVTSTTFQPKTSLQSNEYKQFNNTIFPTKMWNPTSPDTSASCIRLYSPPRQNRLDPIGNQQMQRGGFLASSKSQKRIFIELPDCFFLRTTYLCKSIPGGLTAPKRRKQTK